MSGKQTNLPSLLPIEPGLEILRLAALVAEQGAHEDDDLKADLESLDAGALRHVDPVEMWPELERGLMSRTPSVMIRTLRQCGALKIILPEVDLLFGVQQIADTTKGEVNIGEHLLAALDEAARCNAPLEVRFALLTMNVGKFDSPREHLPVHYRHIERGSLRIDKISARFDVPEPCHELALLALAECERIHRVSEVRAGPVAALLDRVGAFANPARFKLLMAVCASDYLAYGERPEKLHPKAGLIDTALKVCADLNETDFDGENADEVQAARAVAIAQAFRSQRWSSEQP